MIGTQCWTKQNLKVTKYNDNTAIPLVTSGTWAATTGAYAIYDNQASSGTNTTNYGYLYNWYAANGIATTGTTYKNLCPTGYHVPTDAEWDTLTTYLGGVSVAGGKMKETGTILWLTPNTSADNTSGFSGLPGGYRFNGGSFSFVRVAAFFWSATQDGTSTAWNRLLDSDRADVYRFSNDKYDGGSVRCLRD